MCKHMNYNNDYEHMKCSTDYKPMNYIFDNLSKCELFFIHPDYLKASSQFWKVTQLLWKTNGYQDILWPAFPVWDEILVHFSVLWNESILISKGITNTFAMNP